MFRPIVYIALLGRAYVQSPSGPIDGCSSLHERRLVWQHSVWSLGRAWPAILCRTVEILGLRPSRLWSSTPHRGHRRVSARTHPRPVWDGASLKEGEVEEVGGRSHALEDKEDAGSQVKKEESRDGRFRLHILVRLRCTALICSFRNCARVTWRRTHTGRTPTDGRVDGGARDGARCAQRALVWGAHTVLTRVWDVFRRKLKEWGLTWEPNITWTKKFLRLCEHSLRLAWDTTGPLNSCVDNRSAAPVGSRCDQDTSCVR